MSDGSSGADRPDQAPGPRAELRTFLIADIRGYTLFTDQRGDEAAAKLAARFATVTREVVEALEGSVLELRGDEAMCVFISPRQALLAAIDLQDRLVEETMSDPLLPLPAGIGLDVGEVVPVEGGYRGAALNVAARLCGIARGGRGPREPGGRPPRGQVGLDQLCRSRDDRSQGHRNARAGDEGGLRFEGPRRRLRDIRTCLSAPAAPAMVDTAVWTPRDCARGGAGAGRARHPGRPIETRIGSSWGRRELDREDRSEERTDRCLDAGRQLPRSCGRRR